MEPSNERFLRVNHSQTALVLGGTVSSGLPPDLLVSRSKVHMPLQEDTVNLLASVLSPPLCPSALSSKLRVAVLLHGLPGTFASILPIKVSTLVSFCLREANIQIFLFFFAYK